MRSALLLLMVLGCAPIAHAAEPMERYTSTHFALHTNCGSQSATETLAVLEAAWPQLVQWFGARPALPRGLRLDVRLYATRVQWEAFARRQLGYAPPSTWGGMCDGRIASLHVQSDAASTRTVLLHEVVHQFYRRIKGPRLSPFAQWLGEGIAELLARHTWDGERLTLGTKTLVGETDVATRALRTMSAESFDMSRAIRGLGGSSRPLVWALTRYVATRTDAAFVNLIKWYSGERVPERKSPISWRSPTLHKDIVSWLPSQVAPFEAVWPGWATRNHDEIECDASDITVARLRPQTKSFSCVMHAPTGTAWRAGLLLQFKDAEHFTIAMLAGSGGWLVLQRERETWRALNEGLQTFALDKPLLLHAERKGEIVQLSVNGKRVVGLALPPGTMGVVAEKGVTRFRALRWDGLQAREPVQSAEPLK